MYCDNVTINVTINVNSNLEGVHGYLVLEIV